MKCAMLNFGDIRIIKRFAFLPIKIGDETKWGKICFIKQYYDYDYSDGYCYWRNIKFVTEEDYRNFLYGGEKDA